MIKPWGLRHEAGIKSILYDKVFAPDDLWVKKLHTATSLVSALLLTLQLNPTLRRKQLALHRLLGKVFLLLAILQYPFLWYMVCHMKLAVTVALLDAPVVACLPVFAFIGYKKIKAKDVAGHRAHMIMLSCCYFFFGVTRLCAVACLLCHALLGSMLGTGGQKFSDITPDGFPDAVYGPATGLAAWFTFGIGTYNAWFSQKAVAMFKAQSLNGSHSAVAEANGMTLKAE
eukprot:TRINITY_DN339_c0_g1_i10.p2 TRINITY_DN339_c0_g1~~TRINITY_DN339_c0_g1_i10.p2  ORF type:complete len:229 (-),score=62.27 TRINITY_DN339_c0_g1_i10:297-983(-)